MSIQDLWDKLDALPWPAPWVAETFEIDCPCPGGPGCGDVHTCEEVNAPEAYPNSPEEPAGPNEGQCVVQISTPGLEQFAKPCAEFIATARNELPAVRAELTTAKERIAELEADLLAKTATIIELHQRAVSLLALAGEHCDSCDGLEMHGPGCDRRALAKGGAK